MALQVFCFCMLSAVWKKHEYMTDLGLVILEPGQFVTGRKVMARELGLTERNIRTVLGLLEKSEKVTIKTTNKYSIITIKNWDKYQNLKKIDQENDQEVTSRRPADDQEVTTKEESNKVRMKEYIDIFFEAFKGRYQTNPNPPKSTYVNLARLVKSGVSLEVFKMRTSAYFKAAWPPEKDLQGLLSNWDKFAKSAQPEYKGASYV